MDEHNADAEAELPTFYTNGFARLPHDDRKDFELAKRSAYKSNLRGQYYLFMAYIHRKGVAQDNRKGFLLLKRSAEQRYYLAQNTLGKSYQLGLYSARNDQESAIEQNGRKAFDLFQKAADQRNEIAEYLLATAYAKDQSLPQEPEKAFMWAKKSAD